MKYLGIAVIAALLFSTGVDLWKLIAVKQPEPSTNVFERYVKEEKARMKLEIQALQKDNDQKDKYIKVTLRSVDSLKTLSNISQQELNRLKKQLISNETKYKQISATIDSMAKPAVDSLFRELFGG